MQNGWNGHIIKLALADGHCGSILGLCCCHRGNDITGPSGGIITTITVAGLGVVLEHSESIFTVVKLVGGSYLVFLGLRLWVTKIQRVGVSEQIDAVRQLKAVQLYRRGLIVTASNPKAIAFCIALFPQFIDLDQPLFLQYCILSLTMAIIQGPVLFLYAYLSSQIRVWLNSPGRLNVFNRISGATFIGFGLSLFLS
ncbi:MAG: LysE family translocator [Gammaproteobacteria bacterium]|nr:LysE family translocator [Gammaproteobacteria bacterium]